MFPKLSWKLAFFMVLVSTLTIVLASSLANRALDRQFAQFLQTSQQERNRQVVETVRELYLQGKDSAEIEQQLELLGLAAGAEIIITETRGKMMGHHMMGMNRGMMGMGHGQGMMGRSSTERFTLADGTEAVVDVIPTQTPEHMLEETRFRQAVNNSILLAALLSVAGAVVLSTFFSWGLTKPLNQLVQMVRQVGQGDLKQRADLTGSDEISYLGREFNEMAANLERLDKLRIKLTNDMAHEFRTPLTTIQAYLEAMHEGVLTANQENFELVLAETQRLNELLNGLQELAKLEKPLEKKENIDLSELLTTLINSLAILGEEKNITVKWEQKSSCFIRGDAKMLETALGNLLVNAFKYTPDDGRVSVDLHHETNLIKVKITDTGIGIAAQELPFIFERFYRTDLSRSRKTGGTGIGLAVAAEIIAGHGGTIEVESEPGLGSSFTVILPIN